MEVKGLEERLGLHESKLRIPRALHVISHYQAWEEEAGNGVPLSPETAPSPILDSMGPGTWGAGSKMGISQQAVTLAANTTRPLPARSI